jgi:hypothetical protein
MVPDPEIQRIIQQYRGQVIEQHHQGRAVAHFQCLPHPRLIEVPRAAVRR